MKKIVSVKYNGNIIFCDSSNFDVTKGQIVIIDTPNGLTLVPALIDSYMEEEKNIPSGIATIIRIATVDDINISKKNEKDALVALEKAKNFKDDLGLSMKIVDAYYSFDRSQLVITFTADGRIDFRELAKKLANIYKTRIELRQIGVRDNAKLIGGIGPCGRFLCCSTFLTDFNSVSINMAKNQYIALNPSKINGVCGRLLCCLKYEDDQYTDMKKDVPKIGQLIEANGITGKVVSINVFLKTAVLETKSKVFVEVSIEDYNGSSK